MQTHFEVLGLRPSATLDEIKEAYRNKMRAVHPDVSVGGDPIPIRNAYEVISDTAARERYMKTLRMFHQACAQCNGTGDEHRSISFTKSEVIACSACGGRGFM